MTADLPRVPWQEAVDLVRTRRVLVRAGWAYIPQVRNSLLQDEYWALKYK